MQTHRPSTLIALALAALLLQACNQEAPVQTEPVTEAQPPETTTSVYDWHARGVPAGETTIERAGDGRVTTEAFVHWNNREYRLQSKLQLDADRLVFGYGSLIWKQDFPYLEARSGRITGWARRFWQGSHDHRGTEEDPGRVVTLATAPGEHCDGRAFLGPAPMEEMAEQINRCVGPSGSNREYVIELARALREMGYADEHVFEVEEWVLSKIAPCQT